jgi:signal transduction histidine kinase
MGKLFIPLLLFCLFTCTPACVAQTASDPVQQLNHYSSLYKKGAIGAKAYLDTVHRWLGAAEQKQVFFPADSLIKHLSLYWEVASSDTAFAKEQTKYYIYLANNESHQDRNGMAVYFLDKYDKISSRLLKKVSYVALVLRTRTLNGYKNYQQIINLFELNRHNTDRYPTLIANDSLTIEGGLNAMILLKAAAEAYANRKDSAKLDDVTRLAGAVKAALLKKLDPASIQAFVVSIPYHDILLYKHFILTNDQLKSRETLDQMHHLIFADTALRKKRYGWSGTGFNINMINYHLRYKNTDSVTYYLEELKRHPLATYMQPDIFKYTGALFALQERYDSAFAYQQKLLSLKDTTIVKLSEETDNLVSAYIQAEENREALNQAELEKKKRNRNIVLASAGVGLLVLGGFYYMRRKSRKMKEQIEALNTDVDMQITRLEETANEARRNEQMKLGLELHDSIASDLAALVFSTEARKLDSTNENEKNWLAETSSHLSDVYKKARAKSHEWVNMSEENTEELFRKRTEQLVNRALPSPKYKKEILIDNESLVNVNTETRIELLRIMQESITNILKHAKAKSVSILLYEENDFITLNIRDDGKGFNVSKPPKNSSLGLNSIRQRVQSLKGELQINSDQSGTEIHVTIPAA